MSSKREHWSDSILLPTTLQMTISSFLLEFKGFYDTKEEHRSQINQGPRAYARTHMTYRQALKQDEIRRRKLR